MVSELFVPESQTSSVNGERDQGFAVPSIKIPHNPSTEASPFFVSITPSPQYPTK
jgi:hypothetical protein